MNINTHVPHHQHTCQTFLNPHTQYNLPTHHEISQWDASTCQSSTHGCISLVLPIVCCQPITGQYTRVKHVEWPAIFPHSLNSVNSILHSLNTEIPILYLKMSLQGSKFHEPYFYKKCLFRGPISRFVGDMEVLPKNEFKTPQPNLTGGFRVKLWSFFDGQLGPVWSFSYI